MVTARSLRRLLPATAIALCLACGGRGAIRPIAEPAVPLGGEAGAPGPEGGRGAGVYHRLGPGQTLYSIARAYRVPLEAILRVNRIEDPKRLPDGLAIFIPGAARPIDVAPTFTPAEGGGAAAVTAPQDAGPAVMEASMLPLPGAPLPGPSAGLPHVPSGPSAGRPSPPPLAWPLRGPITSRFGRRGRRSHHEGVDIDGAMGAQVLAAAAGTVVRAGREGTFGRLVVIDHGGGLRTIYAHASRLLVNEGDRVGAGDPIAEVGRSGNARGSHLHFEVRRNGRAVDPLPFLRAGDRAGLPVRDRSPGRTRSSRQASRNTPTPTE